MTRCSPRCPVLHLVVAVSQRTSANKRTFRPSPTDGERERVRKALDALRGRSAASPRGDIHAGPPKRREQGPGGRLRSGRLRHGTLFEPRAEPPGRAGPRRGPGFKADRAIPCRQFAHERNQRCRCAGDPRLRHDLALLAENADCRACQRYIQSDKDIHAICPFLQKRLGRGLSARPREHATRVRGTTPESPPSLQAETSPVSAEPHYGIWSRIGNSRRSAPLVDWLDYNGYTAVTKPAKEYTDAMRRQKIKGNMDIEIAVDMMVMAKKIDASSCSPATGTSGVWSRPSSARGFGSAWPRRCAPRRRWWRTNCAARRYVHRSPGPRAPDRTRAPAGPGSACRRRRGPNWTRPMPTDMVPSEATPSPRGEVGPGRRDRRPRRRPRLPSGLFRERTATARR